MRWERGALAVAAFLVAGFVRGDEGSTRYVHPVTLALRPGPSPLGRALRPLLDRNERVVVLERRPGWLRVSALRGQLVGWVRPWHLSYGPVEAVSHVGRTDFDPRSFGWVRVRATLGFTLADEAAVVFVENHQPFGARRAAVLDAFQRQGGLGPYRKGAW